MTLNASPPQAERYVFRTVSRPPVAMTLYPSLAFGFLAGKEVKDAGIGNLGLHDRQSRAPVLPLR